MVGEGALLGDRATMINSQHDRVFMRSMATRGQAGGLSPATEDCLELLAQSGFDYVIIETVGTGQEAMPFRSKLIDQTVMVMNPDYGARLQLQKIVMLDLADIVVVNKSDLDRAKTAMNEIERRLGENKREQIVISTVAKRHRDAGVDELCDLLTRETSQRKERQTMSKLGRVVEAVEDYNGFVEKEVKRARTDEQFGQQMLDRWNEIKRNIKIGISPTGLKLPRLALPEIDEAGDITRYLLGDGLPGEFPFLEWRLSRDVSRALQDAPIETGTYEKNGDGRKAKLNGRTDTRTAQPQTA